ncbi:MAG: Arginine--tRNA ligase [Alphaproteobacteria bacterium MarineAlpha5_Bin5]|nr:MAG: Arginine--tRNA ligase [Alphaproteobacteria bacterium MarineAlpha5_Bin5]PPR52087.1 MAG: Arginine--tRNA ligase [Alphaproteobacteria bacterium MarineAlpha5_Bin4]|tara:strand:+ start:773 stop:2539 length:1767 start_codon:yes stop_codon:yes gene_type:complete
MLQDYIKIFMIDYISNLLNFFYKFSDKLEKNNIVKKINKSKISIDFSSKSKQGEVSSNFYLITKKLILDDNYKFKKILSEELKNLDYIDNHEISVSGFINIFFKKKYLAEHLQYLIEQDKNYGKSNFGNNQKLNIEFVSANPTGPITVAHLRGAVLGDVLASVFQQIGYSVTREYYVNDSGSQIQILTNSLFKRYSQLLGYKVELKENEYPGNYLIELAKKILNKYEDYWIKADQIKREDYFREYAISELIKYIQDDLILLNIKFDKFTYESEIVKKNIIEELFLILNNKKLLYEGILEKPKGEDIEEWESRKQLLFKSTEIFDDRDRAFKKANGEWTYFANDAAYHLEKFKRKYDKLINIWGSDHIGYIQRMRSIMMAVTNKNDYLDIITCQIVRLFKNNQILKMSKREGNFITLKSLFESVGKDPLRYFMISTRSETAMDFNMNKVLEKNNENPVFYCQYAYARASSVINKSKDLNINIKNFNQHINIYDYLCEDEINIILKLLSYPYILNQTAKFKEPHRLTNYLEDLSSSFHSFWNKGKDNESLRLIDPSNIKKTQSKLIWLNAFRIVFKNLFNIIGIESHEKM